MAKERKITMHPWILCCTKNGALKVVQSHNHHYAIFCDSPMGKAMMAAQNSTKPAERRYVLVSDLPGAPKGHAFEDLQQTGVHHQLNCGKEWVFRELVSTGSEMIGRDTGSTMQSFQTWLRNNDGECQTPSCGSNRTFQVVTHVRACKNGKCYTFNVNNHFHFVPKDDLMRMRSSGVISMQDAAADFRGDLVAILQNIDSPRMNIMPTPDVHAARGYEVRRGLHSSQARMLEDPRPNDPRHSYNLLVVDGGYAM